VEQQELLDKDLQVQVALEMVALPLSVAVGVEQAQRLLQQMVALVLPHIHRGVLQHQQDKM
jgi:hypothetical protein